MAERIITISKLDHQGQHLFSYPGEVVFRDDHMIAARCVWTLPRTVELGPFTIAPRDILIEGFYYRQPFNIFVIYDPAGHLKGWYCNVLAYTRITEQDIGWADMALDLLVTPGGTQQVLDEGEFEALLPSPAQRRLAAEALETLSTWASARRHPFDVSG
jgi:protein associated with RNAse G/E